MGGVWSKIVEKSGIPSRSRRSQGNGSRPLLSNNSLNRTQKSSNRNLIRSNTSYHPIQPVYNSQINTRNRRPTHSSQSLSRQSSINSSGLDSPALSQNLSRRSSTNNQSQNNPSVAQPQPTVSEIRHKMNVYCFKKSRNIIQIHQRHATTCANVLNKGIDASTLDIKELAPNTSLTAIGIQQCMQVSDFLLFCKSKNVNYITSQDYTTIDGLKDGLKPKNSPTQNNVIISNNKNSPTQNNSEKKSLQLEKLITKINELVIDQEKKDNIIIKLKENIKRNNISLTEYNIFLNMIMEGVLMAKGYINQDILTKLKTIDFINNIQSPELIQKKELRPMLIFCCSELLRTQQTLFITYFDIIKDYLKNRRKIIVLFWLNEQHFSKSFNADNFVLSLAHTKLQWKYFIKRIKNLEFDKDFMENIGREVGHAELVEFSKKLNLEEELHTSTAFSGKKINYEEWEDIFYVSPHIYPIRDPSARLLDNFSFDNRRFTGKYGFFSKQTVKAKTLYDPKEMYRELPEILSKYILQSTIITHDSDYGVDFYEERIGPNVKMNLVFVSHHNSGENTLKYVTNDVSKAVFSKQQLMNCEMVILPKGGILGIKEYGREFGGVNDEEYKRDIEQQCIIEKNNITNLNIAVSINNFDGNINILKRKRIELLNELYNSQNAVSNNSEIKNIKNKISSIERLIIYFEYLKNQNQRNMSQPTLTFTLKNRIFPVGFYDSIYKLTIKRKNKTEQIREIYPLFILYNSQLDIFFTPLDVIKQEVAIIPDVVFSPSPSPEQTAGEPTGIESSSQIFSLSSPLQKFLNMTLDEYIIFLKKSKDILDGIIKYYYQPASNQQTQNFNKFKNEYMKTNPRFMPIEGEGTANNILKKNEELKKIYNDSVKKNQYFYDYKKLLALVDKSIYTITEYNNKIKQSKSIVNRAVNTTSSESNNQPKNLAKALIQTVYVPPTLLDYLRDRFDTKTLVYSFGSCLFDFCAITEPAKNKLRQIVREKLKLEIGEKDSYGFKLEVIRQLQKFIDDYEKEQKRVLPNTDQQTVIPISKGLFSTKKSKEEILGDIRIIKEIINNQKKEGQPLHDFIDEFVSPLLEIYKKYNIIDNSLIQKINNLRNKSAQNMTSTEGNKFKTYKTEKFKEISEMLRPYQKKFLDSVINKNIRHKNDEKSEKIQNKNKKTVNITNIPTSLKKSKYIVIENEEDKPPLNYIKYQNIPDVKRR